MNRANYAIGISTALFIVWMQRNKRWSLLVKVMDGTYKIRPVS